jgi:hypothetical protein
MTNIDEGEAIPDSYTDDIEVEAKDDYNLVRYFILGWKESLFLLLVALRYTTLSIGIKICLDLHTR